MAARAGLGGQVSSAHNQGMSHDRDVDAFNARAPRYEQGWLGRVHQQIVDRTTDLALSCVPAPQRVLDVGCGTGYLLRRLVARAPSTIELVGIDAAPAMVEVANGAQHDPRLHFSTGVAEHLPYPDATFDLVISTTSFDHWSDQRSGLAECIRVMAPGAPFVLADQFSALLLPTLVLGRRGRARTKSRVAELLTACGYRSLSWHDIYADFIRAVTATK